MRLGGEKDIAKLLLYAFSFDLETKELTISPLRDEELVFRSVEELELFMWALQDQIHEWQRL